MRYPFLVRDLLKDGRAFDLQTDFQSEEASGLDFRGCPEGPFSFAGSLLLSCHFGELDFRQCIISGARFEDCDFSGVYGLRDCLADPSRTNTQTTFKFDCKFPDGIDPETQLFPAMLDRRAALRG